MQCICHMVYDLHHQRDPTLYAIQLTLKTFPLPAQKAYGEGPSAAADKCPNLKELGKKSRMPGFTEDMDQGVWYELAYHDVTQVRL